MPRAIHRLERAEDGAITRVTEELRRASIGYYRTQDWPKIGET